MFNIPDSRSVGQGLLQGFETGSNHMARLLQQRLHQQQLAQQQEHFLQNFGINQSRENRLSEEHPYRLQALQMQQEMGPEQMNLLQARIQQAQAMAERARRDPSSSYKPSELERIVKQLGGGDPEQERALLEEGAATKYGITPQNVRKLPMGSVPLKSLPKNLQAQENADQIKMQFKVNDARKAYHDLDQMEKIVNANPDMARDFAYILGNPEDKSFLSNLSRRYIDKKKLAQIEKFTKLSNDFVLAAGGGLGNNFTDAKLKALTLSKMHAGNTGEANKSIIKNYRQKLKPLINYGKELNKARGKYTLPYLEENYIDVKPLSELTDEELDAL